MYSTICEYTFSGIILLRWEGGMEAEIEARVSDNLEVYPGNRIPEPKNRN